MKFLGGKVFVRVRLELAEHEPEIADFFEGIYSVIFNNVCCATFIPDFRRNTYEWFLNAPRYGDDVSSKQEARLWKSTHCERVVTPDGSEAGKLEKILVPPHPEDNPIFWEFANKVIYYVTPEEFDVFSQELDAVSEIAGGNTTFVKFEDLENYNFMKFILTNIVSHENSGISRS